MNVLYVTPFVFGPLGKTGGGERYVDYIAHALAELDEGHARVRILGGGIQNKTYLDRRVEYIIRAVPKRNGHFLKPFDIVSHVQWADIVHIYQPFSPLGELTATVCRLFDVPFVITDLGGRTSFIGANAGVFYSAKSAICISVYSKETLPCELPRYDIVKGGLDTQRWSACASPPPRDYVLVVGRILPHKGIDTVLVSAPADLPIKVVGPAHDTKYLEQLKSLARGRSVTFQHNATDDDLAALYSGALTTVLASVHFDINGQFHEVPELMGFTLLESMAAGTPPLARNTAAMPEYVEHGVTGFVFSSNQELHDRLQMLRGNRLLSQQMGKRAQLRCREEFDASIVARRFRYQYSKIKSRRMSPRHSAIKLF